MKRFSERRVVKIDLSNEEDVFVTEAKEGGVKVVARRHKASVLVREDANSSR